MSQGNENIKFPLKVLVCEDDFPSRIFITSIVKNHIEVVLTAENGQEGLDIFNSEMPDFIISDIGMPFLNGLEMSRQIKQVKPDIPIILTTAFDNKSVLMDAIEIGINHYIVKPIIKDQLIDVLHKVANSILLEVEVKKQQESIRILYSAIEHSSGMIVIFDLHGKITYTNPRFADLTGIFREEAYGKDYKIFFSEEFNRIDEFEIAIQDAEYWHGEFIVKSNDGDVIFLQASLSPILTMTGEISSFVLVADDITEKKIVEEKLKKYSELLEEKVRERTAELDLSNKQLLDEIETRKQTELELIAARDEAEAANKAKSLFLAKVSHELRTPMNGILGMTSILLDTNIDEKQRRSLNIVKHSGESLLKIINDILDLSKVETGKMSLDKQHFNLREVINYTYDLLQPIAADKGVDLRVHFNSDVPDYLFGDPNRLHQVLVNLIGNSIKFTEDGYIELTISKVFSKDDFAELQFSIRDTGIGIPEDKIHRLFKSFSQIDNNLTRKYGGTGLGLAISKEIVEMMGGSIDCQSTLGVGSVFNFTARFDIKTKEYINDDTQKNEFAHTSNEFPNFNIKVLVAEDSLINQEVISESLSQKKCAFYIVSNGFEAFEAFVKDKFDLILMDIQMPVWDGLKASKEIIAYEKANGLEHTPIFALTAHDDDDSKAECTYAGMDGYLTKPIIWNEMYKVLSKYSKANNELECNFEEAKSSPADIPSLLISINNNEALLLKLINYFISAVPKELDKLKVAINTDDFDTIMKISHKMKSEIGNFKADRAVAVLRNLENKGKSKDSNNILLDFTSLSLEIDKIIHYFNDYLKNRK